MSILERRMLMTPKLPYGYTRVQYIESTGAQYIRTEKIITYQDGFEVEFFDFRNTVWESSYILGAYYISYINSFYIGTQRGWNNSSLICYMCKDSYDSPNMTLVGDLDKSYIPDRFFCRYFFDAETEKGYFSYKKNGAAGEITEVPNKWTSFNRVVLFACNDSGTIIINDAKSKITHYAHFDANGVCDQLFVPAIRNSDSKPGFYDLAGSICPLTGTPFYINSGTGADLIAGPPV